MRSRFLNTNYFVAAQPQFETLKDLDFFNLSPPPPLSPSNPQPGLELDLPFSDLQSNVSSEIDRFPLASALSDFLSDVIPQFIADESPIEGEVDSLNRGALGSDPSEIRVAEGSEWDKTLQFEILEVEFPLRECASYCEVGDAALCFEVPCIKIPLDAIGIEMGVTITYPYEILKSICAVDVVPDCLSVNDDCSSSNKISEHAIVVPEFEVNEVGLDLEGHPSFAEAFNALLPCLEPCHGGDELVINANEILGSTNIDIMERFSVTASSEQCLIDGSVSLNSVLEMDVLNLNGSMVLEKNSTIYPLTTAGDCSSMPCSIYFQEVQILDIPSAHMIEQFSSLQAAKGPNIYDDKMFKYDIDSVGSFYDLIVSSELAVVDDTFKSLPVPILSDGEYMKSHSMILGNILQSLKPHAMTASDGLYLDWHPLVEGICTRDICATYICMLHEVGCCYIASELKSSDEDVFHANLYFNDESPEMVSMPECKEALSELHGSIRQVNDTTLKPAGTQVLKDNVGNIQKEKEMPKVNLEKVSCLFEAMSQSNDLNFFLGARRSTTRKSCSGETMERGTSKVTPMVFSKEHSQPSSLPEVHFEQWDIEVHHVNLTDHLLGLIDNIQKSYLAILNYGTDLRSNTLLVPEDDTKFISLSKDNLLDIITEKSKSQFMSGCQDETLMGLLALYAIKQLAYLLCFFGIHTAHLYISNLTREIDNLVIRLRPLESLIEDARRKSETHIIESHPSLSLVENILKSNRSQNGKILVIADRLFWLPLNQKLTGMMLKPHEVKHACEFTNQLTALDTSRFTGYILDALVHSDCLLVSPENVSDSLPFNKFSIIMEYGGSCASPRICSITPKLNAPRVLFLKVSLENHSVHRAFCEGFDVPHHLTREGVSRSMPSLQGILNKEHIEGLLSFVPLEKASCFSSVSENRINASHEADSSTSMSRSLNSKYKNMSAPSTPDVVIVVNTQNCEKKMLISRRSSYQKVLAQEKEGVQVVEREVNLPLDLIFSAAVCLVWYESRNLGDNMTATSSVPMFIETIATNILMTLSFAFSGCILIFEGEASFLSVIMESSDALYAAAASLDLNLQLFCSYMPESTDEIILSCIGSASKLNRGIFPAMPESETLGESFLTRFPSINTLSAHAILSSGGMLIEFLQWSQKHRIQAIGKYRVPDESIQLFDALCRYGEKEESKSVMTECSSVHSDVSSGKTHLARKRQQRVMSSHDLGMPVDDMFHVEPVDQTGERIMELPPASHPYQLRDFFHPPDMKKSKSCQLFPNDEDLAETRGTYASRARNLDCDGMVGCGHVKENFSDGVINHNSAFIDGTNDVLAKKQGPHTSRVCNLESNNTVSWGCLEENFNNEDIDLNSKFIGKNYPSIPSNISFCRDAEQRNEQVVRSDLNECRLAFNLNSHRNFPTSEEINSDTDNWISVKDRTQSLEERILGRKPSCSSKNGSPMKSHWEYSKGIFVPKCGYGLVSEEKAQSIVEKIHSKATQSSRTHRGLQKTFEFLRSAKDKREVHQQNLACNACLSCPGSSRNMETPRKRQSPSIIESYRYKGGSQIPEKIKMWRQGERARDNFTNVEKKVSSFVIPPTWTPVDKRARQNLSFSRSRNEKQSKLVWRNRCSPDSSCILRKRNRDAV